MEPNRWKLILGLSSDHAGINRELGRLQREMSHALAHIDDARKVRLYLDYLRVASTIFCKMEHIDMRGWMERGGKPIA